METCHFDDLLESKKVVGSKVEKSVWVVKAYGSNGTRGLGFGRRLDGRNQGGS